MRYFILSALILISTRAAFATDSAEENASAAMTGGAQSCDDINDTKPVFDSKTKKFKGCRITSVKTGSGYDKMGLKTGDMVDPDSGKAHSMQEVNKMESGH